MSWLHDLQVVEILDVMKTICIIYYVLPMYCTDMGHHNDAKVYWKLSEMCSQCMDLFPPTPLGTTGRWDRQ